MAKYGNKTVQYSIYSLTEGHSQWVADTTSLKRPDLESLTETITGAGIMGEIDLPTLGQLSSMTYEIAFKRSNEAAVVFFGQKTQHFETRWVTDVLDSSNAKIGLTSCKEIVKAIPKKLSLGSIETNSTNETTVELEVVYYKYIEDGVSLLEIDKLNNVFIVDGWDYAKELREAL